MEGKLITAFALVILTSCIRHQSNDQEEGEAHHSPEIELEIERAEGFELRYESDKTVILSKSIEGNSYFRDSLIRWHNENKSTSRKTAPQNWKSVCCQSSTHLSFLNELQQLHLVTGLCGLQYVNKGEIKNQLQKNDTEEICIGEAAQTETILAQNPDVYFTYPFSAEQNANLEAKGVKTFMIAEYLEKTPLARLEWIKLFGVLFNQETTANDYYEKVSADYEGLKQAEPDTNKKFIMNLPFGDSWHSPSANSLIVKLLEDAGLYYYFRREQGTENTLHSQEEIWELGASANYWVIIASRPKDFSLDDLIAENEVYSTFKSVKHQQVIFCNTTETNYFINGVLEPHIMLKDILFATHKLGDHQPVYFRLLN